MQEKKLWGFRLKGIYNPLKLDFKDLLFGWMNLKVGNAMN